MITRRALAAGAAALPTFAIAQADQRPTITVAVQKISNSNTLEPLREQSNVGGRHWNCVLETLIDTDWLGDLSQRPGLATSWRRPDERTVEFTLREGVRFHDGRAMRADDVVASFGPLRMWGATDAGSRTLFANTGIGAQSKAPPPEVTGVARRTYPGFARMEAVDARTVRFVNRTPDVTLEGRLGRNVGAIVSAAALDAAPTWLEWARRPVGTGPYRIAEFRPDQVLALEAFDDHWLGRPPLRGLRFIEVPETSSRINGLLSGEYDFATDIPPDQIAAIERNPRFEVLGGVIMSHRTTAFDKFHPQLVDPRVRRAFTHAIDRQAINQALWFGRTRIPKGLQFEFYGDMFHADWDVPAYDPAEARRLLAQAGYRGDPIPYKLLNNYYTNQVATAQILVEMWRQVGLNVQIGMFENFAQLFDRSSPRAVRDWSNGASFNDPVASITSVHGPNGQHWQVGEWRNDEMARLTPILEESTDRGLRRRTFRRMLEICEREDPAYTVLHQTVNFTAKRKDLRWRAGQSFQMDFSARNWSA